jgi:tetratricopeptide (TPR) repeat protein
MRKRPNKTIIRPDGVRRMQRVSLSMIVRNEEHFLAGCLESVKGIVDEMIVVDTGSTDTTTDIARHYGAQVFHVDWIGDFSAARNESLKYCTGDWVLYLDADERLEAENSGALRSLVENPNAYAYYCLLRGEEHLPRGTVFNIAPYPRLFRRLPVFRFEGKVHEQIIPSIRRAGFEPLDAPLVIDHLGYAQSPEIIASKFGRNVELLREQVAAQQHDPYMRFQLGNTLAMLGRSEEAMAEMQIALRLAVNLPRLKATILNGLSSICADEERIEEGIEFAAESLRLAKSQVTARWLLATLKMGMQEYDGALPVLQEMIRLQRDPSRGVRVDVGFDASIPLNEAYFRLGLCYVAQHSLEEAAKAFFEGLKHSPEYRDMRDRYLQCVDQLDAAAFAIPQLEWLVKNGAESVPVLNSLARCYLKSGNLPMAEHFLSRCNELAPNDDTWGYWIECHMMKGEFEKAKRVYCVAIEKSADSPAFHRSALQLVLTSNDLSAALKHLEGMAKGVADCPVELSRFVPSESPAPVQ